MAALVASRLMLLAAPASTGGCSSAGREIDACPSVSVRSRFLTASLLKDSACIQLDETETGRSLDSAGRTSCFERLRKFTSRERRRATHGPQSSQSHRVHFVLINCLYGRDFPKQGIHDMRTSTGCRRIMLVKHIFPKCSDSVLTHSVSQLRKQFACGQSTRRGDCQSEIRTSTDKKGSARKLIIRDAMISKASVLGIVN